LKNIKFSLIAAAIAVSSFCTAASAQNSNYYKGNDGRYDSNGGSRNVTAQVIGVQRVANRYASYQHQECWNEQSNSYDNNYYRDSSGRLYRSDSRGNIGGTVLGALIGGALGNQVGKGDGRKAATIGGAVIGGAIGNSANRSDGYDRYSDSSNTVRRCRTVNDGNRNNYDGYNVTYRYGNQTYRSFMNKNPGRTIRIAVTVQPIN
jgi:uncharacterized protein YcfJ